MASKSVTSIYVSKGRERGPLTRSSLPAADPTDLMESERTAASDRATEPTSLLAGASIQEAAAGTAFAGLSGVWARGEWLEASGPQSGGGGAICEQLHCESSRRPEIR